MYTAPLVIQPPPRKVLSNEPSRFSRASRRLAIPSTVVNSPPMIARPSGCNTSARTAPFGPRPREKPVSSEPSAFRRAMKFRLVPFTRVNRPPSTTRPSFCTATAFTRLSTCATKFVSGVPSVFTRATLVRATPPTEVKRPPKTALPVKKPLVRTRDTERTDALDPAKPRAPTLNPASSEPSGFSRTRLERLLPSKAVKSPAT